MLDLETMNGGYGNAPGGLSAPYHYQGEDMVPADHVRQLTTTVVDMLRSMVSRPGGRPSYNSVADGENSSLLWDAPPPSDINHLEYDQMSLASGSQASQGGSCSGNGGGNNNSVRDSEISAQTALLKAQYLPQVEYNGDEVRPFYLDRNGGDPVPGPDMDGKLELEAELAAEESQDYPVPIRLIKKKRINWIGTLSFLIFMAAFIFYVVIRSMRTLPLGSSLWYGIVVLSAEILGGVAMIPYGLCLTMKVVTPVAQPYAINGNEDDDEKRILLPTAVGYHIRVVIPCYKEPLDVVSKTFMAAMYAPLPPNCQRTVYLLDDGKDPEKRYFVRSLGFSNAVYVARKKGKDEMNGKSANINNAMKAIYPAGVEIPLDEVICVFDADQVASNDFFIKMVPRMDTGKDLAMVLSPQTFFNLNHNADIFNHGNVHFWHYMQPGYDALGLISCTGTNFLLRARAFNEAGWFPEWTLTEDFALGIELKRRGWQCSYVDEFLAIGEAPEEVRNCFQQRSRWAKGHFQLFFSYKHNPVFGPSAKGLSLFLRWMYGNVLLCYVSCFVGTPLFMIIPMATVWIGAFPIIINFWAALAVTVYFCGLSVMMYYNTSLAHLKSMWFSSIANSILWFAFLKAAWRASFGRMLSGTIMFKVTAKGLQKLNKLPLRDIWMSTLWFLFSLVAFIFGLVHLIKANVVESPLIISLIFLLYSMIPQYLLLQYAAFRPRTFYNVICKFAMLLSSILMIAGMVLVWVLYPKNYDFKAALGHSLFFMDSQRVGTLPPDFRVSWRKSEFFLLFSQTFFFRIFMSIDDQFSPFSLIIHRCI